MEYIDNKRKLKDYLFKYICFFTSLICILILVGIFLMLLFNGVKIFREVSFDNFFLGKTWNPSAAENQEFGILSMIAGSLIVTTGAMTIAIPLGIGSAAYLAVFAPPTLQKILKPAIELIASIPSVVIGFMGIVLVGPAIAKIFNLPNGLNALNGAILLAVMSIPTIVTISEEAIKSVSHDFIEASYSLGANSWTTLIKVILPSCYSGLIAAVILGVGRAIGETMTVLMATGNALSMPKSFFDSVRTITATIAIELGEVPYGTNHYYSLFAIGSLLFFMTLIFNILAEKVASHYRNQGR